MRGCSRRRPRLQTQVRQDHLDGGLFQKRCEDVRPARKLTVVSGAPSARPSAKAAQSSRRFGPSGWPFCRPAAERPRWRSDSSLLRDLQGVVHLDAEAVHRGFRFGVARKQLQGTQVLRAPLDQRRSWFAVVSGIRIWPSAASTAGSERPQTGGSKTYAAARMRHPPHARRQAAGLLVGAAPLVGAFVVVFLATLAVPLLTNLWNSRLNSVVIASGSGIRWASPITVSEAMPR